FRSIKGKLALIYAISITANKGTKKNFIGIQVAVNTVKTKYNIIKITLLIGSQPADNASAVIGDRNLHAFLVLKDKKIGLFAVYSSSKICFLHRQSSIYIFWLFWSSVITAT